MADALTERAASPRYSSQFMAMRNGFLGLNPAQRIGALEDLLGYLTDREARAVVRELNARLEGEA